MISPERPASRQPTKLTRMTFGPGAALEIGEEMGERRVVHPSLDVDDLPADFGQERVDAADRDQREHGENLRHLEKKRGVHGRGSGLASAMAIGARTSATGASGHCRRPTATKAAAAMMSGAGAGLSLRIIFSPVPDTRPRGRRGAGDRRIDFGDRSEAIVNEREEGHNYQGNGDLPENRDEDAGAPGTGHR